MAAQPSPTVRIPAPPVTLRLVDAPPPAVRREPEWVERSWQAAVREVRRYVVTSWAFARRPRETAHLWAEGRFDALNPIAYLLNTVAILGPWRELWTRILHVQQPLWMDVLWVLTPFVGVVVSASLVHLCLSLAGGKRRITSTWAISIYSTGGLLSVFGLVATPFILLSSNLKTPQQWHDHWLAYVLGQAFSYPVLVWHFRALAGLHGLRARRVLFAYVLGILAFGVIVVFASLQLAFLATALKHRWH